MSEYFQFGIICLVVARLTRMLLLDSGPMGVFAKIREIVGAETGDWRVGGNVELFNCPWCMAVNVAFVVRWCVAFESVGQWLCEALAASFIAAWLVMATHRTR